LRTAATFPMGRVLLAVMLLEWVLVAVLLATRRVNADTAWFLAFLAITSTLFLLTTYDVIIDALHLAVRGDPDEAPERYSLPARLERSELVRWAKAHQGNLAWVLFGAGIVGGHLWWH
jgi:hypothetical protein